MIGEPGNKRKSGKAENVMHLKRRILVVDDLPQHRQAAARLLSQQGFEPLEAASAAEAKNLLATERVTAVLTNMEMPGTSWLEWLQHIHRRYPRLPIILVTPFFDDEIRTTAALWGTAAVLEKPFGGLQIATAIRMALADTAEAGLMDA